MIWFAFLKGHWTAILRMKRGCTAKETVKKKTTLRVGENICKGSNQQRSNLQNIQAIHAAQYQKTNNPNKKWAEDLNRHFSKEDIIQLSSVIHLCPTLCDPMDCRTPGFPVYHELLEFTQTHVPWVSDVIQPSHPLSSPFLYSGSKFQVHFFAWDDSSECDLPVFDESESGDWKSWLKAQHSEN